MEQIKAKAVVFDIGNVLLEWNPERHYDTVVGEARRKAFLQAVDMHAMNDEVDRGGDMVTLVSELAEKHPEWRDEILIWHSDWLQMASPAIPYSVRLLRALRARGVTVLALSNFGIGTFRTALETYSFLDEFDQRFISGHLGTIKPDARIYEILEEETGLSGADLIFTDDRADNIAAAAARGWQVHHFTGPEGWAAKLVEGGYLSAGEAA